ncbi:MAG TPA: OB-fold nucleic acid binding domain-containing protein, partial [Phycisphaerales bacterium]|nr:OB-fold nucleic acid binding domain-containing protein [Phycisphaerales bacterium]
EDLIAANALFRPGPMELIPDYCKRKHRKQAVPRVHRIVDQFTAETYGIMVYQEQVMQIVHGLGNISLRDAYTLIKAISKKKSSVIDAERPKFIKGAQEKGLSKSQADEIFDLILKFAGYGFNKSHSTGYAIIAYHTAYLKTYFPAQYMAALLTYESGAGKVDDWAPLLDEARRVVFPDHTSANPHVGVEVKPPDINLSNADFSVVYLPDEPHDNLHGHVRFGLNAIKGVGKSVVQSIITERAANGPFSSLDGFCERVTSLNVNRGVMEAFIKAGALDSLHGSQARAAMCAHVESAIAAGQSAARDRLAGQMNLFASPAAGATPAASAAPQVRAAVPLPNVPPWPLQTTLAGEKECLGFHISGHPLDQHMHTIRTFCTANTRAARNLSHDTPVIIGGVLSSVRTTVVKNGRSAGERMAMITLQDRDATIDGVVFSSVFARIGQNLTADSIVLLVGRVDRNRGEPQIIVDQVLPIADAPAHLTSKIEITISPSSDEGSARSTMQMLLGLLQQAGSSRISNGNRPADISLALNVEGKHIALRPARLRCVPSADLLRSLDDLLGPHSVQLVSAGVPQRMESDRRPFSRNGKSFASASA